MQQWVDVESVEVDAHESRLDGSLDLDLSFEAINGTAYPLTIERIVTKVSLHANQWETFTVETSVILPPSREGRKSAYPFYVAMKPQGKEVDWFMKGTVLTINGEVTFRDCLQKTRVQDFGGLYECNMKALKYMKPLGLVPDRNTEQEGKKAD